MTGIARPRLALRLLGAGATLATVLACAPGALNPAAGQLAATTQNWTDQQRVLWYKGSQGSRLIPEAWLMALEAPGSTTLFMDPAHFSQYNYLPASFIPAMAEKERCGDRALPGSNALLPVGFARDCQSDKDLEVTRLRWFKGQSDKENWIGLTCAACHTTTITYNGQTELIDGGPTLADFQGFTDDLTTALAATLADPAKWERFAARIAAGRGARRSIADDGQLRGAVTALLAHQTDLAAYNQTTIRYGHGRLDAVGHILNKVAWLNHDPNPYRGEPNAPVSYPFIWNAGQHDFVQWNGLVPSKDITIGADKLRAGALVRNTSEVIGVFADVTTREKAGLRGYRTSVDVANLMGLEVQLAKLMSPAWPAAFGAPEPAQVERGRLLFESRAFSGRSCRDCHADLKRTDLSTAIVAEMTPIWGPGGLGTDPWMACNAFAYQARGGLLTGTKEAIAGGSLLPVEAPTSTYLKTQAIGTLLRQKGTIIYTTIRAAIGIEPPIEAVIVSPELVEPVTPRDQPVSNPAQRLENCRLAAAAAAPRSDARRTLAYKGRPLNGIWATAPYLHNGSVRTLHDVLLPPSQRPTRFWVGNREYDVDGVGYVDAPSPAGSWFSTTSPDGSAIVGNSNLGHDYGNARFSDPDRNALVAYMKSL